MRLKVRGKFEEGRRQAMHIIKNYEVSYGIALSFLLTPRPGFWSRVGGSDTSAVVDYLKVRSTKNTQDLLQHTERYLPLVQRYNGYYDLSRDVSNYYKYCECLLESYNKSRLMMFCNYQLLSIYFKDILHKDFYKDIENRDDFINFVREGDRYTNDRIVLPYMFVEKLVFDKWTLFRAFSETLTGKRVLVISPFAESIEKNFDRRSSFFRNYNYPNFNLLTYNTPITYFGLPDSFYPDENWFQTLERMKVDISKLEFDVALLSCGSYAMPLGIHIEEKLSRRSIYIGGVMQLYFGIMGRRYDNPYFKDQIDPSCFIYPLERERFLQHANIENGTAHEALGAYF